MKTAAQIVRAELRRRLRAFEKTAADYRKNERRAEDRAEGFDWGDRANEAEAVALELDSLIRWVDSQRRVMFVLKRKAVSRRS